MTKHFSDAPEYTKPVNQGDVAMAEPVIFLPEHLQDAVQELFKEKGIPVGTTLKAIRVFALDGITPDQLPYIVSSYLTGGCEEVPKDVGSKLPTPVKTNLNAPRDSGFPAPSAKIGG